MATMTMADTRLLTRLGLIATLLLVCATYYAAHYLPAPGNGSDFQVFYAAGYASAHRIDPFDWTAFWHVEQHVNGLGFAFAPYADTPPWDLVLRLANLPAEPDAYRCYAAGALILAGLGTYLALYPWCCRTRLAASLAAALCPAALFNVRLGQNSILLVFVVGLAFYLLEKRQAGWLAGLVLACGFFKPHISVPVAIIVMLFAANNLKRQVLGGYALGWLALIAATVAFDGGPTAYTNWLGSVHDFGTSLGNQPDLASIPGLYLSDVGNSMGWILNLLSLALAGIIVLWFYYASGAETCRDASRKRLLWGGIATYLAFSPYAHTSDQCLLALPILVLVGEQAEGLLDPAVVLASVTAILAPMVVLTNYHTAGINVLPPVLVAFAWILAGARRAGMDSPARRSSAAQHTFEAADG